MDQSTDEHQGKTQGDDGSDSIFLFLHGNLLSIFSHFYNQLGENVPLVVNYMAGNKKKRPKNKNRKEITMT
jgi:hypothetical protein